MLYRRNDAVKWLEGCDVVDGGMSLTQAVQNRQCWEKVGKCQSPVDSGVQKSNSSLIQLLMNSRIPQIEDPLVGE
jgi:hypothetical protein